MPKVFLGIGSNIDREANIGVTVRRLRASFGELQLSPVYRCPAYGFHGTDFYNLVTGFATAWSLSDLFAETKALERACGREPPRPGVTRFGPRSIDVDILLYGSLHDVQHQIPNPDLLSRSFVLKPMVDIAPCLLHPVTGRSLQEHWLEFDQTQVQLHELALSL